MTGPVPQAPGAGQQQARPCGPGRGPGEAVPEREASPCEHSGLRPPPLGCRPCHPGAGWPSKGFPGSCLMHEPQAPVWPLRSVRGQHTARLQGPCPPTTAAPPRLLLKSFPKGCRSLGPASGTLLLLLLKWPHHSGSAHPRWGEQRPNSGTRPIPWGWRSGGSASAGHRAPGRDPLPQREASSALRARAPVRHGRQMRAPDGQPQARPRQPRRVSARGQRPDQPRGRPHPCC